MREALSIPDRRVHAQSGECQIVRYERAGKWYMEWDPPRLRPARALTVDDAALAAWRMRRETPAATIYFGVPGGQVFERRVRARGL